MDVDKAIPEEKRQFPQSTAPRNGRYGKMRVPLSQKHGSGKLFEATTPNKFIPKKLSIEGDLTAIHSRLVMKENCGSVVVEVRSGSGGFFFNDRRSGAQYVLSRTGMMFFLYYVSEEGRRIPVAIVEVERCLQTATIRSLHTGCTIGKLYRNALLTAARRLFGLLGMRGIESYDGFDCALIPALRMVYESICQNMVLPPSFWVVQAMCSLYMLMPQHVDELETWFGRVAW